MCGFIAQVVEHRTGIAEVTGSNPVEVLIFFRLLLSNCLNWKIYCDDHISLSLCSLLISNQLHAQIARYQSLQVSKSPNFQWLKKVSNGFEEVYGQHFEIIAS